MYSFTHNSSLPSSPFPSYYISPVPYSPSQLPPPQFVPYLVQQPTVGLSPAIATFPSHVTPPAPSAPTLSQYSDPFELRPIPPVALPSFHVEASESFQKKCKRCGKFYKDDALELPTSDACRYHPGHYKSVYISKLVSYGQVQEWTCCRAFEREAPGCRVGGHLECQSTTRSLNHFALYSNSLLPSSQLPQLQQQSQQLQHQGRLPSTTPSTQPTVDDLLGLSDFDQINNNNNEDAQQQLNQKKQEEEMRKRDVLEQIRELNKKSDTQGPAIDIDDIDSRIVLRGSNAYIRHSVQFTDTTSGLSIRYGVSVEDIKAINKLTKDTDLYTRHTILVPFNGQKLSAPDPQEKERQKEEMKKRLVIRFRRQVGCGTDAEALYYLELCDYNLVDAINEYHQDMHWEKTNKVPCPISRKVK